MVSVGPVQSYIIQARKTEDFVSASKIIQFMTKTAYLYLESKFNNIELIYPQIDTSKNDFNNSPNHFIWIDRSGKISKENMSDITQGLREHVFNALKDEFSAKLIKKSDKEIVIDLIKLENHIRDTFYIYVISEEIKDENYEKAYKCLIDKLETLKNYRAFHVFAEGDRKCSICGVRQAVICEKDKKGEFPGDIIDESKRIDLSEGKLKNKLKDKEALCFSCGLKRFFSEDNIYSTDEIASLAWRRGTKYLEKPDEDEIKEMEEEQREKLKEIYPSKFYAAVKMDIDDLGKWFSGKYLKKSNYNLFEFQKNISSFLIDFAQSIEEIIGKDKDKEYLNNQGLMVYAGGDDVMFFVPVAYLFDVLEKIDKLFTEKVVAELDNLNKDTSVIKDKIMTLSRSIVIAHRKTPLNKVLKTLFISLDEAKDKYKHKKSDFDITKNATAFTFITGSNSITTTYFKNEDKDNLTMLQSLTKAFSKNLSKSFIHTLIQEFAFVEDKELQYDEMLEIKKMFECEIDRIFKRKWSGKDDGYDELNNFIKNYMRKQTIEINNNVYMMDFRNFFNMLYVAERLSREI